MEQLLVQAFMYAKKTFNLGAWTYERDAYYNVG